MYAKADGSELLNPGMLRHQIQWQDKVITGQNASGEDEYEWATMLTCRAQVQATGGRETWQVMQKWADAEFQIIQHYTKGLKAKMRVLWLRDGEVLMLDVLGIDDPPGMGRYQRIACKNFEDIEVLAPTGPEWGGSEAPAEPGSGGI